MKKFWNNFKDALFPSPSKDLTKIVKDCEFRIFESYVGSSKIDPEDIAFVTVSLQNQIHKRLLDLKKQQELEVLKTKRALAYLEN